MDVSRILQAVYLARSLRERMGVKDRPVFQAVRRLPAPYLKLMLIVTVIAARSHRVQAQALPNDPLAPLVNACTDPLVQQHLPQQLEFAKKVCKLSDEQALALDRDGREAINRIGERLLFANRQPANRARNLVTADGRNIGVPAGFDQDAITAPGQFVRRELSKSLKANWPEAWETFKTLRNGRRITSAYNGRLFCRERPLWRSVNHNGSPTRGSRNATEGVPYRCLWSLQSIAEVIFRPFLTTIQ